LLYKINAIYLILADSRKIRENYSSNCDIIYLYFIPTIFYFLGLLPPQFMREASSRPASYGWR
jgi:hypothetical protein